MLNIYVLVFNVAIGAEKPKIRCCSDIGLFCNASHGPLQYAVHVMGKLYYALLCSIKKIEIRHISQLMTTFMNRNSALTKPLVFKENFQWLKDVFRYYCRWLVPFFLLLAFFIMTSRWTYLLHIEYRDIPLKSP